MRSVTALAVAIVALFMISAVPFVANDAYADNPYADPYVDFDNKITINGLITGYDSSSVAPKAILFVVIEEAGVYKYINVNESATETKLITDQVKDNKFSLTTPTITSADAEYYICFDMYSIKTVPWIGGDDSKKTIIPEHPSWPDSVSSSYVAYKIPRSLWDISDPDVWITDKNLTDTGLISLQRSEGEISGHVSTVIRGDPNDLADVRVELINTFGKQVAYTNTDSKGNYSMTVPTGSYELRFYRGNYSHEPVLIEVNEGTNNVPEVTMELEKDTSYFGYDLEHFLMFIGAGICVVIVIMSIVYQYKRMKGKKTGKEWILDDMPGEEED